MSSEEVRKTEFSGRLLQYQMQFFGYVYSMVRDFDDADDLFQQTSLVLWNKYNQFDPSRSFIAWACGVARLEVLNFLRTSGRQRLYFTDELNLLLIEAQVEIEHEEFENRRQALTECRMKLRRRDQELLETCYGGSARIPELAQRWAVRRIASTIRCVASDEPSSNASAARWHEENSHERSPGSDRGILRLLAEADSFQSVPRSFGARDLSTRQSSHRSSAFASTSQSQKPPFSSSHARTASMGWPRRSRNS